MKSSVLKVAAVVSALALGGVYVVVQQRKGAERNVNAAPGESSPQTEPTMMVGSKSLGGEFEAPLNLGAGGDQAPPVLMPSSKVIVSPIFVELDDNTETLGIDESWIIPDAIMTSSKSGAVDIDPKELAELLKRFQQSTPIEGDPQTNEPAEDPAEQP